MATHYSTATLYKLKYLYSYRQVQCDHLRASFGYSGRGTGSLHTNLNHMVVGSTAQDPICTTVSLQYHLHKLLISYYKSRLCIVLANVVKRPHYYVIHAVSSIIACVKVPRVLYI
jgi:hypothetical protein